MQITNNADRLRFQREYMFYDCVMRYNQAAFDVGEKVISISEACEMHRKLQSTLCSQRLQPELRPLASQESKQGREPSPIAHARPEIFMQGINEVFAAATGGWMPYDSGTGSAAPRLDAEGKLDTTTEGYQLAISQARSFASMSNIYPKTNEISTDTYLPISPFDNAFSDNEAVRANHGRLMAVKVSEIGGNLRDLRLVGRAATVAHPYVLNDVGEFDRVGDDDTSLENYADFSGLSKLRPYIEPAKYDAIRSNVLSAFADMESYDNTTMKRFRQMIDVSETIIQELNERGYSFSIEKGDYPGQVKCLVENTGVSIRLMDVPEQMRYIGHCYVNGVQYSVNTSEDYQPEREAEFRAMNAQDKDESRHNIGPDDWVFTPEAKNMLVDNVLLALNEPLKHTKIVQGADSIYRASGQANYRRYGTYARTNGLRVAIANDQGKVNVIDSFQPQTDRQGNPKTRYDGNFFRYEECLQFVVDRKNQTRGFYKVPTDAQAAEDDLKDMIETARQSFTNEVAVYGLRDLYLEHKEAVDAWTAYNRYRGTEPMDPPAIEPFIPEFTGDSDICALQKTYWNYITGASDKLKDPSQMTDEGLPVFLNADYYVSREEACLDHLTRYLDVNLGAYDPSAVDGLRFNPAIVERFGSAASTVRNKDRVIKNLRFLGIAGDELRGDDAYINRVKDKLVTFNRGTARAMDMTNDFDRALVDNLEIGLAQRGGKLDRDSVVMDDQGICRYKTTCAIGRSVAKGETIELTGEIGPFFKEHNGTITTSFAGSDNFDIVPAKRGVVSYRNFSNNADLIDRIRVFDWQDDLMRRVRLQVGRDLEQVGSAKATSLGDATSLLSFWRHELEGERYVVDQREVSAMLHMPEMINEARREANGDKVIIPNSVAAEANIFSVMADRDQDNEQALLFRAMDDRAGGWYAQSDYMDWKAMVDEEQGYFAPAAATGGPGRVVKRLAAGATIEDGRIIPSEEKDLYSDFEHTANIAAFGEYDCLKRRQMAVSNMEHANGLAQGARVAQCVMGGWTQDDAFVVSREFADRYGVSEVEGIVNPLMVGDKLSDMHGNKGVISAIVDPDMTDEEADARGLRAARDLMRANPGLDVIMAPFSGMSRNNGGTAREAMQQTSELHLLDGSVVEGGIGSLDIIIHDKTAEAKTNIYTNEDIAAGGGRRCGWQLSSALVSHDCQAVMREMFGHNTKGLADTREYLRACGLDIEPDGTFVLSSASDHGEQRRVIETPRLAWTASGKKDSSAVRAFAENLDRAGGVCYLPFPLTFKTGYELPEVTMEDGTVMYEMPIMSAHLRSGTELSDGTATTHDYTNWYRKIGQAVVDWDHANHLENPEEAAAKIADAQKAFDALQSDVIGRKLESSHNVIKKEVMSCRLANSATAIWSPDPSLNIDEVGMSPVMAESLGIEDGDQVLIWRDPVLTGNNLRYLTARVDRENSQDLTGISVHPGMAKPIGGDFDGDTIGVWKPQTYAARKECEQRLTMAANLLDYTNAPDEQGRYALNFNFGDDFKIACQENPDLGYRLEMYKDWANELEANGHIAALGEELDIEAARMTIVQGLSECLHEGMTPQAGVAAISYADPEAHLRSLEAACVDTGIKGNSKKLSAEYARYFGVDVPYDETTDRLDFSQFKDNDRSLCGIEEDQDCAIAMTATVSFTGVAGSYPQYAQMALCGRECDNPSEVMDSLNNLTSKMYQVALDWKHYGEKAKREIPILQGPYRDTWNGYKLEEGRGGNLCRVRDEDGEWLKLGHDAWIDQFNKVSSMLGMSYDQKDVQMVADVMTDHDGIVRGLSGMYEEENEGSLLHKLAYSHDFEVYRAAAEANENLFDSPTAQFYAPGVVKAAQKAKAAGEEFTIEKEKNAMYVRDTQDRSRTFVNAGQELKSREAVMETVFAELDVPDFDESATVNDLEMGA